MAIPAYYSLIQRGSSGPDVALVQTWLNGIRDSCTWHAALTVDGKFGANAEKAVREFQLRYDLKEDGKVGANTWNVLYARYTAKHGLTVPYPGIVLRSGSVGGGKPCPLRADGPPDTGLSRHPYTGESLPREYVLSHPAL